MTILSLLIFPNQAGNPSVGIIYPPVTSISVELSEYDDAICSAITFITDSTAGEIERDIYTVTITQTNSIGSTVAEYKDILDCK